MIAWDAKKTAKWRLIISLRDGDIYTFEKWTGWGYSQLDEVTNDDKEMWRMKKKKGH